MLHDIRIQIIKNPEALAPGRSLFASRELVIRKGHDLLEVSDPVILVLTSSDSNPV